MCLKWHYNFNVLIQEAYEKQLELLEAQLQTAQDTMAAPVEPTSMEQLQKQLAQHEVNIIINYWY